MKLLTQMFSREFLSRLDRNKYPDGFFRWLMLNEHIWREFELRALIIAANPNRKRYSARTIIEVIRWNTDIKENQRKGKPTFKLSNNMVPGLARLWMEMHGHDHPKFFQLQEK